MRKSELVARVAAAAGLTKVDAGAAVDGLFGVISEALAAGEKVTIVGFGSFGVRARAGRTGRNPRTKQPMVVEASQVPVFRAGKTLKERVGRK